MTPISEQIKKEAQERAIEHQAAIGFHEASYKAGWDHCGVWVLKHLQVPVWVKATDEIWPYLPEVLVEVKNGDEFQYFKTFAHNVIECYRKENIRWLKPSPILPLIEAQKKIEELERELRLAVACNKDQQQEIEGLNTRIAGLTEQLNHVLK